MNENILIVDNNAATRNSTKDVLEESGYHTFISSSAKEAIKLLETTTVDIVITDVVLPDQDGLEFTDLIKQNHDVDVIVMTDYSGNYSYEDVIYRGASDLVFKPVRPEEMLLRLKRVIKERQLNKERAQMLGKLEKLAITDGLTKLYNLRHFYNQLEIEIDRCNRYGHHIALLLLDIDHFKVYNDTYGHLEGDKVLVRLGQIIKSCLRTMDSAYRYGGEEFTIILPETTGDEATNVAGRLKTAVELECFLPEPGKIYTITISIGVTEYHDDEKISDFILRADKAMYKSKATGRNRISSLYA